MAAVVSIAVLPLVLAFLVLRRVGRGETVSLRLAALLAVFGAGAGAAAVNIERLVLEWTDLDFEVSRVGASGALLAMFLLAAPLEEGSKVLVVVSAARRRVRSPRLGLTYAVAAAAGFAAAKIGWTGFGAHGGAALVRLLFSVPAHLFFAGAWGYALGVKRADRWFRGAWLVATMLHGLYDHIVVGRGPGLLVATFPMLIFMAILSFMALRGEAPRIPRRLERVAPPSIEAVRDRFAHRNRERKLMLHWVIAGAFVTLGLIVVTVAAAVIAGNRFGMDFALADEADVRAAGPLVVLGVAVLAAFPAAGYLNARASSAGGLLEPALAAALTVGLLVGVLWLAAPIGVLLALAVAPVALALACGGAWIGLER
jgi:RsiW-degrading membrane proteinase PrsW (M82 family)